MQSREYGLVNKPQLPLSVYGLSMSVRGTWTLYPPPSLTTRICVSSTTTLLRCVSGNVLAILHTMQNDWQPSG